MFVSAKRAFTLIELLVVIAIIAILAAILFPVFAQARQAARGAASLSNIKQQSLAMLMYTQDYDETFVLDETWGDQNAPIWFGTAGSEVSTWAWNILPYIKSAEIFGDPLAPSTITGGPFSAFSATIAYCYGPAYGYNYTALSPSTNNPNPTDASPWIRTPATLASVSQPSDTVMLGGRSVPSEVSSGGLWWAGVGTFLSSVGIEAPECYTIVPWCWDNWGQGGFASQQISSKEAGAYTGFNSVRKALQCNLAFTDGHVKFMQPGAAAAGTNWNFNLNVNDLQITDPTKYIWDTL